MLDFGHDVIAPHARGAGAEAAGGEWALEGRPVVAGVKDAGVFRTNRLRTIRRIVFGAARARRCVSMPMRVYLEAVPSCPYTLCPVLGFFSFEWFRRSGERFVSGHRMSDNVEGAQRERL